MTAVMAIDFLTHILVISDCRISYEGGSYEPQDYLQKVYPFEINGLLAFAGDIVSAKAIFTNIRKQAHSNKSQNTNYGIKDFSIWAKEAYEGIPHKREDYIEIMFVVSCYSENREIVNDGILPLNCFYVMNSPEFELIQKQDYICLGYAKNYDKEILIENRNNLLNLGLTSSNRKFQMAITVGSFSEELAKLGNNTVGGLFSVGVVTPEGVDWLQYSIGGRYKLEIEDGKFIQYDLENDRNIPLQTVFDYSPKQYRIKNLRLDTPHLE